MENVDVTNDIIKIIINIDVVCQLSKKRSELNPKLQKPYQIPNIRFKIRYPSTTPPKKLTSNEPFI